MQPKVLVVKDNPSFIRRKHELTDLERKLSKAAPGAVDRIISLMDKEGQTDKMQLECAKLILSYEIETAKAINQDQLTRQIAEIKVNGKNSKELTDESDEKAYVDFDTIEEA